MSDGIRIRCHNCNHVWTYSGSMPRGAYTNCPNRDCRYKVKIPDEK